MSIFARRAVANTPANYEGKHRRATHPNPVTVAEIIARNN